MDGATSVADQDYADHENGDVAWFVRAFAAALAGVVSKDIPQHASVPLALQQVESAYWKRTGNVPVPRHALPLAAMTWIRITRNDDQFILKLYCLGDCKALLRTADGTVHDLDPYVNPYDTVLQAEVTRLAHEGVTDPALRFTRLLPMLRRRREAQHAAPSPSVLVLQPQGRLHAREFEAACGDDSMLIAMTDGFYRAVDTYALYSVEELASLCQHGKLADILQAIRDFERGTSGARNRAVKKADDASAVACHLSSDASADRR